MGILTKCFEIVEKKKSSHAGASDHDSGTHTALSGPGAINSDTESDDTDGDEDEDGDNAHGPTATTAATADTEDPESDAGGNSGEESDDEASGVARIKEVPRFRLREILFYDDKISIFRARHGRL